MKYGCHINEIITHQEIQRTDEENTTMEELTRRDFLKFSALGTAVVMFPLTSEKAEANPLLWAIIALTTSVVSAQEYVEVKVTLGNPSKRHGRTEYGHFKLGKTTKYNPKKHYANLDKMKENFYIPKDSACTFYSRELVARTNKTTYASVKGHFSGSGTWYSSIMKIIA